MSNPSIEELMTWMKGKSITRRWGALVAYDRRKSNQLLRQLYIERFNEDSYLPLISMPMELGEYTVEHLSALKLSMPRLSFEHSNLDDEHATMDLTMDFIGGMIATEVIATDGTKRIDKIQKVLPIGGPQLSMKIALTAVQGEVGAGEVTLDISEGRDYKANFVLGSINQADIGRRFQQIFEETLKPEQRKFSLGQLAGDNGALTPTRFSIRAMPAPGATQRDAANYQDGAILLFVALKDGVVGDYPSTAGGFKYPIPKDRDGKEYTGAMYLSSRTLFEDIIRQGAIADIGNGIAFKTYAEAGSSDRAWSLEAKAGGVIVPDFNLEFTVVTPIKERPDKLNPDEASAIGIENNDVAIIGDGVNPCRLADSRDEHLITQNARLTMPLSCHFPVSSEGAAFVIKADDTRVAVVWTKNNVRDCPYWRNSKFPLPDVNAEFELRFSNNFEIFFDLVLDPVTGVVSFETNPNSVYGFDIDGLSKVFDLGIPTISEGDIKKAAEGYIKPKVIEVIKQLTPPSEVNTFLARNLLFPGHNALQLTDARLPGDLALFGHIDPMRTSFSLSPVQPIMEVGGTQQFKAEPAISGLTWSVRGTEPGQSNVGSIDGNGLYKAPAPGTLDEGYRTVVVNAKGKVDGKDVMASALVSVLESTIAVTPMFKTCIGGASVDLSAEALEGVEPAWTPPTRGKLSHTTGRASTYTAPEISTDLPKVYMESIEVKSPATGATTTAEVMVLNGVIIAIPVIVSEDSNPDSGQVRLQLLKEGVPVSPDGEGALGTVIHGGGELLPNGVYKQAANASGFAVIHYQIEGPWGGGVHGYIVLPLPLSAYGGITRQMSNSVLQHARRNPQPWA